MILILIIFENYVKEGKQYVKLSISSAFTYFECYTHVFANTPCWLNNEVPEAIYYYDFTELF